MAVPLLDLSRQYAYLKPEIEKAIFDVLDNSSFILGPQVEKFEEQVAALCEIKHAVGVASGTDALLIALRACGVKPGDEVITTDFSFFASAGVVSRLGARPVFVDIEPDTYNIDPNLIEAAITPKTKVIMPVHLFGQVADMDPILTVARRHELVVIEDSCEALGSRYQGRPAGSLGDAGVFGFYPNKQITTGEGGMIVTDDERLAGLCRSIRNQGRDTNGGWLAHPRLGYNYRLSDIACALGIVQLGRINEIIAARSRVEGMYRRRLADERRITMQKVRPDVDVSWFVFVVRLSDDYGPDARDRILRALSDRGIGCSNYFAPIHLQKFYVERYGHKPGDFPVCEALAARTIALPFHHELTEEDIDTVCRELRLEL